MLLLLYILLALLADSTCSSIVGGLLKPWDISQTIVKDSERDVCSWKLIQPPNILIPYNMCLRSHGDVLSDEIRRVGYWPDCTILPKLWGPRTPHHPKQLFVDIGANLGSCSLVMSAHGAHVLSFEPQVHDENHSLYDLNNKHLLTP